MITIENAFKNWKTTSLGLAVIGKELIHLWFIRKTMTEADLGSGLTNMLIGSGFIFAGDASHSQAQIQDVKQAAATAIDTGNTDILTKPQTETKTP